MDMTLLTDRTAETGLTFCDLTQAYASTSGGIRTYIDAKSSCLARYTAHRHVLIVPGERDTCTGGDNRRLYTVAAPRVPKCHPYRFILRLDKVVAILRREMPHLIELGSPYVLPWTALFHRARRRCAVVGFYHTDFPTAYVRPAARALAGERPARLAERAALGYAANVFSRFDATLVASEALAGKLEGAGVTNVIQVSLGVDTEVFHPSRRDPEVRRLLGIGEGERLFVYAGRLDREKRVEWLVRAFQATAPALRVVLAVVGDGPLRPFLERRASEDQRLRVLPFISERTELARLLASSDIYVTAGPYETFGLSVAEAQACGLPVIGVRAGALLDRVPPHVGRLIETGDAAGLSAAMIEFGHADLRNLSAAARELVERSISWKASFERLLPLYESLAARTAARPAMQPSFEAEPEPPRGDQRDVRCESRRGLPAMPAGDAGSAATGRSRSGRAATRG